MTFYYIYIIEQIILTKITTLLALNSSSQGCNKTCFTKCTDFKILKFENSDYKATKLAILNILTTNIKIINFNFITITTNYPSKPKVIILMSWLKVRKIPPLSTENLFLQI